MTPLSYFLFFVLFISQCIIFLSVVAQHHIDVPFPATVQTVLAPPHTMPVCPLRGAYCTCISHMRLTSVLARVRCSVRTIIVALGRAVPTPAVIVSIVVAPSVVLVIPSICDCGGKTLSLLTHHHPSSSKQAYIKVHLLTV